MISAADPGTVLTPGTEFWVKIHISFDADADPEPGIFLTLDPGSSMEKIRIRDKHLGYATPDDRLSIVFTFQCKPWRLT